MKGKGRFLNALGIIIFKIFLVTDIITERLGEDTIYS